MRTLYGFILVLPVLLGSQVALADDGPAPKRATESTYDLGVRVGGYGFRREGENAGEQWTECQRGGVGVFASRKMMGPLYLEAGIDAYTSRGEGEPQDLPIDRMSSIATIAGGARTNFTSWMRGFVQLGGGVELTRVAVPY